MPRKGNEMAEYMVCATVGARRSQRAVVVADSEKDAIGFAREYWRAHGEVLGEVWFVKVLPRGSIFARASVEHAALRGKPRAAVASVATAPIARKS